MRAISSLIVPALIALASPGAKAEEPVTAVAHASDSHGCACDTKSHRLPLRVSASAEAGTLAVLAHELKFSEKGTLIDLVDVGGQDNLYTFLRFSMDLEMAKHHVVTFLFQPLEIDTRVPISQDLQVDDHLFKQGESMQFLYSFPFTRASYMYDLYGAPDRELAFGVSLQLRNARIEAASADGSVVRSIRDVGPVPLLKARGRWSFDNGLFWGFEVDGTYAAIKGINGSDNEVTGALLDSSLRIGTKLRGPGEAFVNLRYLGGGAEGKGDPDNYLNDGVTRNWLHFLTISLGANIDLL